MTFNMRLGDVMSMRSAILEHSITPWLEGEQSSCEFWTNIGLFKASDPDSIEESEKTLKVRAAVSSRIARGSPRAVEGGQQRSWPYPPRLTWINVDDAAPERNQWIP